MPKLIRVIPNHRSNILSAISEIENFSRNSQLSDSDSTLVSAITAHLIQIKNLIPVTMMANEEKKQESTQATAPDEILIDEDQFNAIRQALYKQLNKLTNVSPVSRQLWLILSTMTKVSPLNKTTIIDLEDIPHGQNVSRDYFYASSGHAFKLAEVVQFQRSVSGHHKFCNLFWGANIPFNHLDQRAIIKQANNRRVNVPDARQDAEQFLINLYRRILLHNLLFATDVIAQAPAIYRRMVIHFSDRRALTGSLRFLGYLTSEEFVIPWGFFTMAPLIAALNSPVNDGTTRSYTTMALLAGVTSAITMRFTNVLEMFFSSIEFSFRALVYTHMITLMIMLKTKEKVTTNDNEKAFLAQINNINPLSHHSFILGVSNFLIQLNGYFPNNFIFNLIEAIVNKINLFFIQVVKRKFNYEIEAVSETAEGQQVQALFNRARLFFNSIQDDFRDNATPTVYDYLTALQQQIRPALEVAFAELQQGRLNIQDLMGAVLGNNFLRQLYQMVNNPQILNQFPGLFPQRRP